MLNVIGYFRVTLCLDFKASPRARPHIWTWVGFAWQRIKLEDISIWMVLHEDSFHRDEKLLGNGLAIWRNSIQYSDDSVSWFNSFPLYSSIRHLCSVDHLLRPEHHSHERRCYTARDHSDCSDTGPRPQKSKQPGWNWLRNSITVPKGNQVKKERDNLVKYEILNLMFH